MGALATFLADHGITLEQGAIAVGADPRLFTNVDALRQPMPLQAIEQLASLTGAQVATIKVACFWWTARSDQVAFNPLPPEPGEPFQYSEPVRRNTSWMMSAASKAIQAIIKKVL